jgi:hypothetical protein
MYSIISPDDSRTSLYPVPDQMNDIIFIIRVLKLLFMNRYRILVLLCAFFIIAVPVSASLQKIAAGAPVFIGENNLDISLGLNGHSVIGWWAPGSDTSGAPDKTIAISTDDATKFTIRPDVFTGYTGKWYTYDKAPNEFVFEVMEPQIDLKVWDVDNNRDITGQSIPSSTNITYRIDTNLYLARKYTSRPEYNPSDLFVTVKLTNPNGIGITQVYTGNIGNKNTQIINVESTPVITTSTYYWKDGPQWDRNARSADGSIIYPPGTYTFTLTQNLNSMRDTYNMSDPDGGIGKITSGDKTITFLEVPRTNTPTLAPILIITPQTTETQISATPTATQQNTVMPTSTKTAAKTTYAPFPAWLAVVSIGIVALVFVGRRER